MPRRRPRCWPDGHDSRSALAAVRFLLDLPEIDEATRYRRAYVRRVTVSARVAGKQEAPGVSAPKASTTQDLSRRPSWLQAQR